MRILILGSDYSARKFFNLANNEKNIVFSCVKDCNYIEFENFKDIFDFIEANEINFVLILDEKYISNDLIKELVDMNVSVLSASEENIELLKSKSNLKRFIYKNKILTPKFQIFEKPQSAIDFVYSTHQAYAIKPDNSSYQECVQFAKSRTQAQKIINKFFENGNKKILIEDYIEGKNVCFWALSNGYSAKIIGTCAKYQDNLSYFEPEFIDEKFNDIVDFSELKDFLDVPVKNFSSGMTAKLAFSIATIVNPEILIVDEILSVGDIKFQEKSKNKMMEMINGGTTVLYVSHSLESIKELCNRVIWIEHGVVQEISSASKICEKYYKKQLGGE